MPFFQPTMSERGMKNYDMLRDFLHRISYKPGWSISLVEEQSSFEFVVRVSYDGYESENAIDTPLAGGNQQAARVAARLLGKTFRSPERRYFNRRFDRMSLDTLRPEDVIRYVIVDTIKQAEMFEFYRWFKVDGYVISGKD
jgi:hypothetical protein